MTRFVRLLVASGLILSGSGAQAPTQANGMQAPDPSLRIVSPTKDTYLSGPVLLRAVANPPAAARLLKNVTFFADGLLICRIEMPPFECPWDAGSGVKAHQIRVTATLPDGRRIIDSVRTQELGYVEAVEVPVVQVTAVVTDPEGRFVDGLGREAFRIFDEEAAQSITYFADEEAPLHVVVAVDVSGSMTDAMPGVKTAVKSFLTALDPKTEVTLVGFNDNVFVLSRRGPDPASRVKAVDRLAPWGGTALYDAVLKSIELLSRGEERKALVIFTDGDDQSSFTTREATNARVEASDAVIFTIAQGRGTRDERFKSVLDGVAQVSGGRAFFTEDLEDLDKAFREIATELSHQYMLGYAPAVQGEAGAWRRIRVEMNDKRLRVRARKGYRVGGE